jgi:hypothetical protein
MAIRFRRSMKIAPGLRLNIGKKSASVRVGGRGGGVTLGSAGSRATVGAPGSGLSYSKKIGGKRPSRVKADTAADAAAAPRWQIWLGVVVMLCITYAIVTAFVQ